MCVTELDRFYRKVQFELVDSTFQSYSTTIKQFSDFILKKRGEEKVSNWDEFLKSISTNDVEDYRFWLIEEIEGGRRYTIDSANTKFYALKSLFSYLGSKDNFNNPIANMTKLKPNEQIKEQELANKKEKEIASIKEIKEMISATYVKEYNEKSFDFTSARNRFIIAILSSTGMRIGELLGVRYPEDLVKTEEGYEIRIKSSMVKNKINKILPITHHNLIYFNEYLLEREKIDNKKNYLIVTKNGNKMGRDSTSIMINKYMSRLNPEKKISNHSFRHSANSFLRANGTSEAVIKSILGWKESGMSGTVYNHETEELRLKKIEACASVLR